MRLGGCIGCPKLFPLRSTKWTCEDQVLHFWTSPKPQKNLQISLKFIKTNKKYGIKCKRCEKKLKTLHKKVKKKWTFKNLVVMATASHKHWISNSLLPDIIFQKKFASLVVFSIIFQKLGIFKFSVGTLCPWPPSPSGRIGFSQQLSV